MSAFRRNGSEDLDPNRSRFKIKRIRNTAFLTELYTIQMSGNKKNKMENMTERKDGVSKEKNFKGKDFIYSPKFK